MAFDDLPIPADTTDTDATPALHEVCAPLRPLVGVWRGEGEVDYPTIDGPYRFGQLVRISHDGRPFLHHDARAWLVNERGELIRPAARETGWWRPQPDGSVELLLTHATGILELFYGTATGTTFELRTETVLPTATAKDVSAAERHYEISSGGLSYRERRAMVGRPLTPHVTALLHRQDP